MKTEELIRTIHSIGGSLWVKGDRVEVEVPRGRMTTKLRAALEQAKPDLLRILGTAEQLEQSADRLERMHIALRIESRECGCLWLIGSESSRELVRTNNPIYTIRDARILIQLEPEEVRKLQQIRRLFGGTLEWRNTEPEGDR